MPWRSARAMTSAGPGAASAAGGAHEAFDLGAGREDDVGVRVGGGLVADRVRAAAGDVHDASRGVSGDAASSSR